jgi:hypothetical protein
MIKQLRRYGRAFVLTLQYTLRGEKPPLLKVRDEYPSLAAWWTQTIVLVEVVEQAAAAAGIDIDMVKLRIDKRDISMKTILATVRFHAERDYPYLIAHGETYDAMTLQATNVNDRYLVMQLANNVDTAIKPSVEALRIHLDNLPSE